MHDNTNGGIEIITTRYLHFFDGGGGNGCLFEVESAQQWLYLGCGVEAWIAFGESAGWDAKKNTARRARTGVSTYFCDFDPGARASRAQWEVRCACICVQSVFERRVAPRSNEAEMRRRVARVQSVIERFGAKFAFIIKRDADYELAFGKWDREQHAQFKEAREFLAAYLRAHARKSTEIDAYRDEWQKHRDALVRAIERDTASSRTPVLGCAVLNNGRRELLARFEKYKRKSKWTSTSTPPPLMEAMSDEEEGPRKRARGSLSTFQPCTP